MRRPTETQLAGLEDVLVANLQKATRALPLVQLVDVAPETGRKGQMSDRCVEDDHRGCRDGDCDCLCHDQWKGYSPSLPDNYQGVRNHPVGKTWHDSDITSSKGTQTRPSREWLERFDRLQQELAWLARHAVELVGEPVATCRCNRPIFDGDPAVTSQGERWHRRCYQRHYRGRPLISTN